MSLSAKQDDWSNLLNIDSIASPLPTADLFGSLTSEDRLELAAVWVTDGIHARHTDYPKSSREIQLFKLSRSPALRNLYNFAVIVQLFATFLDNQSCDHDFSNSNHHFFRHNGAPTRLSLTILDLFCLVLYVYDLYLVFAVNPTRKSLLNKPWSTLRLFICLFVFMDCLLYFTDPGQPRLMRCVFPFLLISKRNNLKLMCQGLLVSGYKSMPIIKALVSILLLWGFIGFVFFRATDGNYHSFRNPGEGIAEALHCFTSRPYVLKALDSIYSNNQASALYFVSLTLAADILCIALIVATGAKHYKQFAGNILHNRLVDRRHAITCAFHAIASPAPEPWGLDGDGNGDGSEGTRSAQPSGDSADGTYANSKVDQSSSATSDRLRAAEIDREWVVTRENWMALCARMSGKYAPTPHTADFIFDLAINGDPRENTDRVADDAEAKAPRFLHTIDKFLFFRCCALVGARIVVQLEAAVEPSGKEGHDRSSTLELAQRMSTSPAAGANKSDVLTVFSPGPGMRASEGGRRSSLHAQQQQSGDKGVGAGDGQEQPPGEAQYEVTMLTVDAQVGEHPANRLSTIKVLRLSERPSTLTQQGEEGGSIDSAKPSFFRPSRQRPNVTKIERDIDRLLDWVYYYMQPLRDVCVQITGANVTVMAVGRRHTVNVFYAVNIFLLMLLTIDISFISQVKKNMGWYIFSCFLEVLFWLHLSVRVLAVGVRRFVSFYENQGDSLLNLCSLIALIELGKDYARPDYNYDNCVALGWYLLFQAFRLFKVFFAVNDVKVFEHMRPVLIRASFIYFSIVYFFSIFGYSYFCNAMNVTDAANTSQSNDASQWVQYENLLNFNTLLQSVFTLFEISILGNWSIVMDAAVASTTKPASAYIFFYTYRLVVTLFVLPILLSFIIQVFLSAINLREQEIEQERANHRLIGSQGEDNTGRFSLGKMGIFTANPYAEGMTAGVTAPGSNKVSYNVNQEVLTLGRRPSAPAARRASAQEMEGEGEGDTLSPLPAAAAAESGSTPKHKGGVGAWPRMSLSVGVDSGRTKYAHTQSETVSSVGRRISGEHSPGGRSLSNTSPLRAHPGEADAGATAASHHQAAVDQKGGKQVKVQYDSRAGSSMVSIWAIDGNAPTAGSTPNRSAAQGAGEGRQRAAADRELAQLQARLDAALKQLEAERHKNKALLEHTNLI